MPCDLNILSLGKISLIFDHQLKLYLYNTLIKTKKTIQKNSNYLLIISNNSTSKINKLFAGIVGLGLDP